MGLYYDPNALDGLPKRDFERISGKIDWIWENRSLINHHPLRQNLSGYYKRVLGKYRIVYSYDSVADDIVIIITGTRDTIYDDADRQINM